MARTQGDMESLLAELANKEEEINLLRSSSTSAGGPSSLDEEMISTIRQQQTLELSAAQSRIRALETSLFDADARSHALQRQLNALELDQRRQSFSSTPPRPSSRGSTSDLRKASFVPHKPSNLAATPVLSLEEQLSPETRHKRKVSLSMLKARIQSEATASHLRALSPVLSVHSDESSSTHRHHQPVRSQFLDDSHIFWCSSCRGDLVIL